MVGGDGEHSDDRFCSVAVAAGRRSQAVADLDATFFGLALEADPPDCPPVGQAGDPVVAEWPLLSALGGGAKEGPYCANVALEGEIVRPSVAGSRTSSDDALSMACSCRRGVRTSVMALVNQRYFSPVAREPPLISRRSKSGSK